MGLLSIFRKRHNPHVQTFGGVALTYDMKLKCWQQSSLEFWGIPGVDISFDAGEAGPSSEQIAEYWRLVKAKGELLPRLLHSLQELESEPTEFVLVGVHIPRLDGSPTGELGRFWFDRTGDNHFMYGVESEDRWRTLQPHRDD